MPLKLTKEDKEWAKKIKTRDNNKCVVCGSEKKPNAHHILPKGNRAYRYDEMNGITLCPKHHRFSFELSAHQNPFVFMLWLAGQRRNQYAYLVGKCDPIWIKLN